MLYYLIVYAFANVGAFAVAAWLARDLDSDNIDDLNGLGYQEPLLATCILILMLSLIGIPPLAGFFGKLYVFMEALNQTEESQKVTLIWLVALGLMNSVVSAFYYVRVLKAMFLREAGTRRLAAPDRGISIPIVLGTVVVVVFGLMPASLMSMMQGAAVPMLTDPAVTPPPDPATAKARPRSLNPRFAAPSGHPGTGAAKERAAGQGAVPKGKGAAQRKRCQPQGKGAAPTTKPGVYRKAKRRHQRRPIRISIGIAPIDERHARPHSLRARKSRTAPRTDTRRHGHGHYQHVSEMP